MPRHTEPLVREIKGWPGSTFELLEPPYVEQAGPAGSGVPFAKFSLPWGNWTVTGLLAMTHNNQAVISEITVSPAEGVPPGGISHAALNLPLGRIRADVWSSIGDYAVQSSQSQKSQGEPTLDTSVDVRPGRKPYSDDELEKTARLYLDIQQEGGRKAQRVATEMSDQLGVSIATINKRVRRATERGFLGPPLPGRSGRLAGPRLQQTAT